MAHARGRRGVDVNTSGHVRPRIIIYWRLITTATAAAERERERERETDLPVGQTSSVR